MESDIFREAIYLASPELAAGNVSSDTKKEEKYRQSLIKYYHRSKTRCTPFGLFAGCSIGVIGDDTIVELSPMKAYRRTTRLDMQYLCALTQHLEKQPAIRLQSRFYPNDSLYSIGGQYRYIAYHYHNAQRRHEVVSLTIDDPLNIILQAATKGATIQELATLLIDDDNTYEDAMAYVNDIIDAQVLKSNLDPSMVGNDVLDTLIEKLACLQNVDILKPLRRVKELLNEIDTRPIGSTLDLYSRIIEIIDSIGVGYDVKFLFQTDLFKPVQKAVISNEVTRRLSRLIGLLARITPPIENTRLSSFIQAFQSRYEETEIPLATALDRELGIGYPLSTGAGNDVSPLLSDLYFPVRTSYFTELRLLPADKILLQKYSECTQDGGTTVHLSDEDFKEFNFAHKLPNTLAVMCSLLSDGKIYVRSIGSSSGANLLSRFCHIDPLIRKLVMDIAAYEQQADQNRMLAEIAHFPESRIGNIASRPAFRDYTIHYLSNCMEGERALPISDLLISVRNGRLFLRSQRYDKEILPRLTCAHNYSLSPIPIYRFLCDLQHQGQTTGLSLNWNYYLNSLEYLPRIEYEGIILSRQRWMLKPNEVEDFCMHNDADLKECMKKLRLRRRLLRHVVVPDSDNELYLDLENSDCIRLLLDLIIRRKGILLEEFLFTTDDAIVRENTNIYTNEFIFAFHQPDGL